MYKVVNLKIITKFGMHDLYTKNDKNLSNLFWNLLFDRDYFLNFVNKKYIPYIIANNKYDKRIVGEVKFILLKLDEVKKNIDLINNEKIEVNDLFFSYKLFEKILSFYNDYYSESQIEISLTKGLTFQYNYDNKINIVFNELKTIFIDDKKNKFINDILLNILDKHIEGNNVFVLKIFWPTEIFLSILIGNIIKFKYKKSKILISLGEANEQFDYTNWEEFIEKQSSFLSNYFDYFVVYSDFGESITKLKESLSTGDHSNLTNLISIESGEYKKYGTDNINKEDSIQKFIKGYSTNKGINKNFGKNGLTIRMFPYKCYWSKCSFCTINAQNSLTFDNNYSYDFFMDLLINHIKKNKIYSINFLDEAISPLNIIKFAKKIIENNLEIIYQFRTRFDKTYTKDNCKLLYKSGARYCGIGLESASTRINEQVGNKGESDISLNDKYSIISNFDSSGIAFHNYAIMGFPTETKEETTLTYIFLLNCIKKFNYYTTTPNIYSLMKGSYIFDNLDEFGIKVDKKSIDNLFNLNFNFNPKVGEKRDMNLYNNLAGKVHVNQFVPWLYGNGDVNGKGFWDYIDRTGYFYRLKMIHKVNPYKAYKDINLNILNNSVENILKTTFNLSNSVEILSIINDKIHLFDWVNSVDLYLNTSYLNFINNYDNKINLQTNLLNYSVVFSNNEIIYLLENRILTIKNSK